MELLCFLLVALLGVSRADIKVFSVRENTALLSFTKWQTICNNHGGRLASINSALEQSMVERAIQNVKSTKVLIGMKRRAPHKGFINGDGKPLTYTNWNKGEPNDAHGDEDCVEIYTKKSEAEKVGKWNDCRCSGINNHYVALCERNIKVFSVRENTASFSFTKWQTVCKNHGGRLASINNALEQTMANKAIQNVKSKTVLTGMKRRAPHKGFINGDGKPLPYTNWYKGQPDDSHGEECVELYTKASSYEFGKWNDKTCASWGNHYVALCERIAE